MFHTKQQVAAPEKGQEMLLKTMWLQNAANSYILQKYALMKMALLLSLFLCTHMVSVFASRGVSLSIVLWLRTCFPQATLHSPELFLFFFLPDVAEQVREHVFVFNTVCFVSRFFKSMVLFKLSSSAQCHHWWSGFKRMYEKHIQLAAYFVGFHRGPREAVKPSSAGKRLKTDKAPAVSFLSTL